MVVHRSIFKVHSSAMLLLLVWLASSCGDSNADESKDSAQNVQTTVEIPPPPFSVNLAPGYDIVPEMTMVGVNYYFQTNDPVHTNDAGGIYIGAFPDTSSPPTDYSKREYLDVFMGDSAVWREFITRTYTHREVFVNNGESEKIHSWCYAHDSASLEQLTAMIKSIRKK